MVSQQRVIDSKLDDFESIDGLGPKDILFLGKEGCITIDGLRPFVRRA